MRSSASRRADPEALGARALRFIESLSHVKGEWAGHPFRLAPWQRRFVRTLFGTTRDQLRQYRTCYLEVPRKNGKTSIGASIALYLLVDEQERGGEIYSAAVDLDQASLVFDVAASMLQAEPELMARAGLEIIPSRRRIVNHRTGTVYRAIPADAPTSYGYNASAVIYDELHAAPNRALWDVLTTSMGARRQPLVIVITTAGYDRHTICWELHDYASKVRDGILTDPTFLPVLYGATPEEDWTDPRVWKRANPNLGVSLKRDYVAQQCRRAQETPGFANTFRRLHLNIWTESESRWLDLARWDACAGSVDVDRLAGRPCFAGLDLSTTTDLTALVLLFPEGNGHAIQAFFWVPAANAERRALRDRVPYEVWARAGVLELTEGNVVDYDVIRERIRVLAERYRILEIAYDRWNASQLVTQLQHDGATLVPIGQGFASLSAPAKELEKLVLAGALRHGGHPVLRWCVANAVSEQDAAGNIKPSKRRSTERIDGVMALVMALARAMLPRPAPDDAPLYVFDAEARSEAAAEQLATAEEIFAQEQGRRP